MRFDVRLARLYFNTRTALRPRTLHVLDSLLGRCDSPFLGGGVPAGPPRVVLRRIKSERLIQTKYFARSTFKRGQRRNEQVREKCSQSRTARHRPHGAPAPRDRHTVA